MGIDETNKSKLIYPTDYLDYTIPKTDNDLLFKVCDGLIHLLTWVKGPVSKGIEKIGNVPLTDWERRQSKRLNALSNSWDGYVIFPYNRWLMNPDTFEKTVRQTKIKEK